MASELEVFKPTLDLIDVSAAQDDTEDPGTFVPVIRVAIEDVVEITLAPDVAKALGERLIRQATAIEAAPSQLEQRREAARAEKEARERRASEEQERVQALLTRPRESMPYRVASGEQVIPGIKVEIINTEQEIKLGKPAVS